MDTVPTIADEDEDYPDAVGLAAAAARYLNRTGYPEARLTTANQAAAVIAARKLITTLMPEDESGWISGESRGGGA